MEARGVPALSGVVEYVTQSPYDALLRLDKPGPGVAALGAFNFGGQIMVAVNLYLYGDQAAEPSPARRRSGKRGLKNASRCRRSRARENDRRTGEPVNRRSESRELSFTGSPAHPFTGFSFSYLRLIM